MRKAAVFFLLLCLCLLFCACGKDARYEHAQTLLEAGQYDDAITAFSRLGNYKDSRYIISTIEKEKQYAAACALLEEQNFPQAYDHFNEMGDYKDSLEYLQRFQEISLTPDNWQEYFQIQTEVTLLKDAFGDYTDVVTRYFAVPKQEVAARFYRPIFIADCSAYSWAEEREISIDPKTGEYKLFISDNCYPARLLYRIPFTKRDENGIELCEEKKHSLSYTGQYTENMYTVLDKFVFKEFRGTLYLYCNEEVG